MSKTATKTKEERSFFNKLFKRSESVSETQRDTDIDIELMDLEIQSLRCGKSFDLASDMICTRCKHKESCDWYASRRKIEHELYLGIGTDNKLGMELAKTLYNNMLVSCIQFEGE